MFRMIAGAFVALFLCLTHAAAQPCVSVDSLLEKITASKRAYRLVEAGPVLERLRQIFAETPPESPPPRATRAIVIDFTSGIIVAYVQYDMACSSMTIAESAEAREIRVLVFGERA